MKLSDIHQTLGEVRKELNLSQRDIAEALNVEQATVSMYENGKRGIPLDILDDWLQLLEIEIKVIPKGFEPVKPAEDIKNDLEAFNKLKKERNYFIAELRAMMAEKLLQVSEFQRVNEETGEGVFWPYSFQGDEFVGLVETRYDHPEQKYMAIEYTSEEVNAYRFLSASDSGEEQSDLEWLNVNRIYFSEDDFLTLGEAWNKDSMNLRKMTILRKSSKHPDGVEIVDPEGFPIRALAEMMENFNRFAKVVKELEQDFSYTSMEQKLDEVRDKLVDIILKNRLGNGSANPDFVLWTDEDSEAIDVPLFETPRSWFWLEDGVAWTEDYQEMQEIQLVGDHTLHENLHILRNADGTRVVGLIGDEQKPALFKSNRNRPNAIYRVEIAPEDLNSEEHTAYRALLSSTKELETLRDFHNHEEAFLTTETEEKNNG